MIKKLLIKLFKLEPEVITETEVIYKEAPTLKDTLKAIDIDESIMDNLTKEEESQLLSEAHVYYNSLLFKILGKSLINKQTLQTIQEAETLRQLDYGRAVVNATMMYEEEINKLNIQWEELNRPEEEVEYPNDVI